jgi:cytochrome c oxidase cbb3-type subunit 3
MSEQNRDKLTDHNYDGIQEYDNPLPRWWLLTFYGTVIFAAIYWVQYEIFKAPTQLEELKLDLAEIKSKIESAPATSSGDLESELKALLSDPSTLAKGKEVYQGKCAVCHGVELQGIIGPNLVDEYWIHSKGEIVAIADNVRKGFPDKGMPPWEALLKPEEVNAVAVFVASNRGSKPNNPKAPQGEKVVGN